MRKIKSDIDERVETGALKINDDGVGLFIRGDQAEYLAGIIKRSIGGKKPSLFEGGTLMEFVRLVEEGVIKSK